MRHAFFITGFNNWGKTTLIYQLFSGRRFMYGHRYKIDGMPEAGHFTVQSQSNDDLGGDKWVSTIHRRIETSNSHGYHLVAALCPSIEPANSFVAMLQDPMLAVYDQMNVLLLEYKWDHHARLLIDNITQTGSAIPNINFLVINADEHLSDPDACGRARLEQVRMEIRGVLGI